MFRPFISLTNVLISIIASTHEESMMFFVWSQIGRETDHDNLSDGGVVTDASARKYQTTQDKGEASHFQEGSETERGAMSLQQQESTKGIHHENCPTQGSNYDKVNADDANQLELASKPHTPTKVHPNIDANVYCVEKKKCPFCEEVFTKGNEFSSHLLKCTARRRARKQRRRKKRESPDRRHGDPRLRCLTSGRRMPWE